MDYQTLTMDKDNYFIENYRKFDDYEQCYLQMLDNLDKEIK